MKGGEELMKNKYTRKIVSAVAGAAMLLQLTPALAFASISCTISGNGSDSSSTCDFASLNKVEVNQNNDMDVNNDIDVDASTGGNSADDNTGGEVEIATGDANVDVTAETAGNTNTANVAGTSSNQDYTLEVSGNGTNSDNEAVVNATNKVKVSQDNNADVDNDVDVDAHTGYNDADDNTGGDVSIKTGDASVNSGVAIMTSVNANSAFVGGNDNAGDLSIKIMGNGSNSDNLVDLALLNEVEVEQDNDADVDNDVDVDANTGHNDAEDNTGGEVAIETGDAEVDVTIDTMVNFNSADVESGFLGDAELKVSGNGTNSDNEIEIDLTDDLDVDQDNDGDVDNDVDVDAKTGHNDADDNTVGEGQDPVIETGDADTSVETSSSGNVNVFGDDMNVEFDFDMSELLSLLSALSQLLNL